MARRRKKVVMLVGAVVGLLAGAAFIGFAEFLPTLVLPHGGWDHVSTEMWTKLIMYGAAGGTAGLVVGTIIQLMWRR